MIQPWNMSVKYLTLNYKEYNNCDMAKSYGTIKIKEKDTKNNKQLYITHLLPLFNRKDDANFKELVNSKLFS